MFRDRLAVRLPDKARERERAPLYRLPFFCVCFLAIHHFYFPVFWTRRGHKCLPFSPPGGCLNFYRSEGSALLAPLVDCRRSLLTHALALSAMRERHTYKVCTFLVSFLRTRRDSTTCSHTLYSSTIHSLILSSNAHLSQCHTTTTVYTSYHIPPHFASKPRRNQDHRYYGSNQCTTAFSAQPTPTPQKPCYHIQPHFGLQTYPASNLPKGTQEIWQPPLPPTTKRGS